RSETIRHLEHLRSPVARPSHAGQVQPQRSSISSDRKEPWPPVAFPPTTGRASARDSFSPRIRPEKRAFPVQAPLGPEPTARDARRHLADPVPQLLLLFF